MTTWTPQSTTPFCAPRLTTAAQRFLTGLEAGCNDLVAVGLAGGERLDVAIACDAQQAAELANVEAVLVAIADGAEPIGAARAGLIYLARARRHDANRDQQVGTVRRLVGAVLGVARSMAAAIAAALTTRARDRSPA